MSVLSFTIATFVLLSVNNLLASLFFPDCFIDTQGNSYLHF